MRHKVEKDPADYMACYNLGAALEAMGKPGEAIDEYRRAIQIRPLRSHLGGI